MRPQSLVIVAGSGAYPLLLAESARRQGIERLAAVGFKRETDRRMEELVDEMTWVRVGQLEALLKRLRNGDIKDVVMAGQLTPSHLFTLRFDATMRMLISRLRERNATTLFGGFCNVLEASGLRLHPASLFMESAMPDPGLLGSRKPDAREETDIALGIKVAKTTSGLEIGQTVVVKKGTILAVEAFEGTDKAIRRGGKLGGPGAVVVKVAKHGHDMRYDIPVVGTRTMKHLALAKASALAVEAGRTILLERERLIEKADQMDLAFVAIATGEKDARNPRREK